MDFTKTIINAIKIWVNKQLSFIENKISDLEDRPSAFIQPEEPNEAPNGTLWIDTDEDSISGVGSNTAENLTFTGVVEATYNGLSPVTVNIPKVTVNGVTSDENGNIEIEVGMVKTVNDVGPDESGNVIIDIPEAVTSWNDLTDRPFYEEIGEVAMLDNVTMDCSSNPQYTMSDFPYEFIEGNTYTVIVNGTEYSCVAYPITAMGLTAVVIGNATLVGGTEGNNEPFIAGKGTVFSMMFQETGTYTVTITGLLPIVHALDEKFISYTAGRKVAGQTFTINGEEVVAGKGAEIFNHYEPDAELNGVTSNIATGIYSHAEGAGTVASGQGSHAEGGSTTASNSTSHAEGAGTVASGQGSHAEGFSTTASGDSSHAEGDGTTASGYASHAEGFSTTASGDYSHAEGLLTTTSGETSHAEGNGTIAASSYQHAQGKYNIEDSTGKYAHIVGNGEYDARSNAHTLDWDGNAWFAGDVYVGSTSGTNKDDGSVKLAKLTDIPNSIPTPTTATVGQTVVVKAVDENGKPTEWEAVDIPDANAPKNEFTLNSSTEGSTKRFKITIDDTGTLTITEIVEEGE